MTPYDSRNENENEYEKDGAAIYRQSFATIRAEADLSGLPADVGRVAVRMIHACGMVDLVRDLSWSPASSPVPARPCWPVRPCCATCGWWRAV